MTSDYVLGSLPPLRREVHNELAMLMRMSCWMYGFMAAIQHVLVGVVGSPVRPLLDQSQLLHAIDGNRHRQGAVYLHASDFGEFAILMQGPNLFEDFVELHLVR